jgi:hypothetical protein
MGRSVRGIVAPPPVGFKTTLGEGVAAAALRVGLAFAAADATADVAGPFGAGVGVGVFTGRGWDIGVS